jgi:uncharacterized protein (TIGR00369 family)
MTASTLKMNVAELTDFLAREFPQAFGEGRPSVIETVAPGTARVRFKADEQHLRPGGTISGPATPALRAATLYDATLAPNAPVPLAVTTNLTHNVLRKPAPGDLIADCKLLKLGKRLAVGEVAIHAAGDKELVAHCVATYSIPPDR